MLLAAEAASDMQVWGWGRGQRDSMVPWTTHHVNQDTEGSLSGQWHLFKQYQV